MVFQIILNIPVIAIPGCIAGEIYQTTTRVGNCTCWRQGAEKCGYICDNAGMLNWLVINNIKILILRKSSSNH